MDIYNIRKCLYDKFGAESLKILSVLFVLTRQTEPNLHSCSMETGIGYRTIQEAVLLFHNEIHIDELNGNVYMSKEFIKSLSEVSIPSIELSLYEVIKEDLMHIISTFTQHNINHDHISATSECCYYRAKYLSEEYDTENCSFLFLGDHDFTSISFAIFQRKLGIQPKIYVMDIDENVLAHIKKCSLLFDLNIATFYCDFRYAIPSSFVERFDVIFTDPPYTPEGIDIFVSKALMMLKRNVFSTILLCFKAAEQKNTLGRKVQEVINRKGLYIRELLRNFNVYYSAEALGYRSDLYICLTTPLAKKEAVCKEKPYNIYTHGKNAVEKNKLFEPIDSEPFEFLYLLTKKSIYIGDTINSFYQDKLNFYQFINQKESGKFHFNAAKDYIIDIRNREENAFRIILWCEFPSLYLITPKNFLENNDDCLLSIIKEAFEIKKLVDLQYSTVFLLKRNDTDSIITECIGKRGTVKNTLVKKICAKYKMTKNEARSFIDTWKLSELNEVPLYFQTDYTIKKLSSNFKEIKIIENIDRR